jgi:glycosyltransferase involved in cell wall biosynthesis
VDRIVIFDNGSTDGSVEIIQSHPKVQGYHFDTAGRIRDDIYLQIKNFAWKTSRRVADFVIVCAMDEFLYHPDIAGLLQSLLEDGYTITKPVGFEMVSDSLPKSDGMIYDEIRAGVPSEKFSKSILFSLNAIEEIGYLPGCHECNPTGSVRFYASDALKLLHYKHLSLDYVLTRTRMYRERLSDFNRNARLGYEYDFPDEAHQEEFLALKRQAHRVV